MLEYNEVDNELDNFLKDNPEFKQYAKDLEEKYSRTEWKEEVKQFKPIEGSKRHLVIQEEEDPYLYYNHEFEY